MPPTRAERLGQASDEYWLAALRDVRRRPYVVSARIAYGNSYRPVLHKRRDCAFSVQPNKSDGELLRKFPSRPTYPGERIIPRPVFLTAAEAAAFLTEDSRNRGCLTCGKVADYQILRGLTVHRIECGLGWPEYRPKRWPRVIPVKRAME